MFPILLDLKTLSLVLVCVTAFLTFVIIFVRWTQKTYDGFDWWVFSNIFVAIGIMLLGIDGMWADFFGTTFTFSAVLIGYEGNRRFLKLKNNFLFSAGILFFHTAAFLYVDFVANDVVLQISFTSLLVGVISAMCGLIFAQNRTENTNFSYRFTTITYFIFAFIMISRSIITFYSGDKNDFYRPDGIQPIFFTLYILFEIIWTFNYINLNGNRLYNELEETRTELEKLATTDFLTGIKNNRSFFEIGENEMKRAKRFRSSLSLIMFDIDFFKKINDDYGHSAGDRVLIEIAETCRNILRETDTLARIGGEEFAVLLPHTDIEGAATVAEFIRAAIEELNIKISSETIKISASFGVAQLKGTDRELRVLLDRADILLYEAKSRGRNLIVSEIYKEICKKTAAKKDLKLEKQTIRSQQVEI